MWTLLVFLACRPGPKTDAGQDTAANATKGGSAPSVVDPGPSLLALPAAPANLILISIDTLRRDHIDRYANDDRERAPFLSSLLADGVALDHHVQCSNWTYPAMFCSLSGRYLEEGTFFPRFGNEEEGVPPGQPSLARYLGTQGFVSHLETTNRFVSRQTGTAQGYAAVNFESGSALSLFERGQTALEGLENPSRWFLHLHIYEPHLPYLAPPAYLDEANALPSLALDLSTSFGQNAALTAYNTLSPEDQEIVRNQLAARYRAAIRYMDDQLADGFDLLDAGGWLDDTLVVVWTDHGEQFWEHGAVAHAKTLHAEENDAILGFWAKNLPPLAVTTPTHAVDLVPTVVHALGLPLPDGLSGHVLGQAPATRPRYAATVGYDGAFQALLDGDLKLHYSWDGSLTLYDRSADPAELHDLAAAGDPRVAELWAQLAPRVEMAQALIPELDAVEP